LPDAHHLFVGTYSRRGSRGIYSTRLDGSTGALSEPVLGAETENPTFLALSPDGGLLYAVSQAAGMVTAHRVSRGTGTLESIRPEDPAAGRAPCHVAVDKTGRTVLAVNFHTAIVGAMPARADGSLGVPRVASHVGHGAHPVRQASAHPHCAVISPDNRFALVCDLGLDRIFTYRLDSESAMLAPGSPPFVAADTGSGPRHLAFGPGGKRAYVLNEINNTVDAYAFDTGRGALERLQAVSTLPVGFAGESSAAEIAFHPNGRFLYASNRGHDTIASFSVNPASGLLSAIGHVPCGGEVPRHFALSPGGAWLVCAHQDSDTLCSFRVDPSSGELRRVPGTVRVPAPTCVLFGP